MSFKKEELKSNETFQKNIKIIKENVDGRQILISDHNRNQSAEQENSRRQLIDKNVKLETEQDLLKDEIDFETKKNNQNKNEFMQVSEVFQSFDERHAARRSSSMKNRASENIQNNLKNLAQKNNSVYKFGSDDIEINQKQSASEKLSDKNFQKRIIQKDNFKEQKIASKQNIVNNKLSLLFNYISAENQLNQKNAFNEQLDNNQFIIGKYLIQKEVYKKGLRDPFIPGEKQGLQDLSLKQKCYIVTINFFEIIVIFMIILTSCLSQNILFLLQLIYAFTIIYSQHLAFNQSLDLKSYVVLKPIEKKIQLKRINEISSNGSQLRPARDSKIQKQPSNLDILSSSQVKKVTSLVADPKDEKIQIFQQKQINLVTNKILLNKTNFIYLFVMCTTKLLIGNLLINKYQENIIRDNKSLFEMFGYQFIEDQNKISYFESVLPEMFMIVIIILYALFLNTLLQIITDQSYEIRRKLIRSVPVFNQNLRQGTIGFAKFRNARKFTQFGSYFHQKQLQNQSIQRSLSNLANEEIKFNVQSQQIQQNLVLKKQTSIPLSKKNNVNNNSDLNERNIFRQASEREIFQGRQIDKNENVDGADKIRVVSDDKISAKSSSILGAFKQRFQAKIQNNFKQTQEIVETVREQVFCHPYAYSWAKFLFIAILVLIAVDIAAIQTFEQIVFMIQLLIVLIMWLFRQKSIFQQLQTIFIDGKKIITFNQYFVSVYLFLTIIFNVKFISQYFEEDINAWYSQILCVLGILHHQKADFYEGQRIQFLQNIKQHDILLHQILTSIILTLSVYFIAIGNNEFKNLQNYEILKEQQNQDSMDINGKILIKNTDKIENSIQKNKLDYNKEIDKPEQKIESNQAREIKKIEQQEQEQINKQSADFIEKINIELQSPLLQIEENKGFSSNNQSANNDSSSQKQKSQNIAQRQNTATFNQISIENDFIEPSDQINKLNQNPQNLAQFNKNQMWAEIMLWICRLNTIIFSYMYHQWFSLIFLSWVFYSINMKIYLPFFIAFVFMIYTVNINQLFDANQINQQNLSQYAIFIFKYPLFEIIYIEYMIFCYFLMIKLFQNVKKEQMNYIEQGRLILKEMVSENSGIISNLLIMILPFIEIIYLFMVLASGLNDLNMFQITFFLIFVFYVGFPKKRIGILQFNVFYCQLYFLLKYSFTMLYNDVINNASLILFLRFSGIYSSYDPNTEKYFFKYQIKSLQWETILMSYMMLFFVKLTKDQNELKNLQLKAYENLFKNWHMLQDFLNQVYNIKSNIIVTISIIIFQTIILTNDRSIISWGFQAIVLFLVYTEIRLQLKDAQQQSFRITAWRIMYIYTAFVILIDILSITFIFYGMAQNSIFINLDQYIPQWLKTNKDILGLIFNNVYKDDSSNQYKAFYKYFIILCLSIYVTKDQSESQTFGSLKKELNSFQADFCQKSLILRFQQSIKSISQKKPLIDNQKIDQSKNQENLEQMTQKAKDSLKLLKDLYNKIKVNPIYISYKLKKFWKIIDFYCKFHQILIYWIIMILNIFWWFNFVNILLLSTLLIFNNRIRNIIERFQTKNKKIKLKSTNLSTFDKEQENDFANLEQCQISDYYKNDNYQNNNENINVQKIEQTIDDVDLLKDQKELKKKLDYESLSLRRVSFGLLFSIINMTIFCIFGSENLGRINQNISNRWLTSVTYYMFLAGVYHQPHDLGNQTTFLQQTWGYYLIYFMCIIEYFCIQWLKDRFMCTDQNYSNISQIEDQIQQLESILSFKNQKQENKLSEFVSMMQLKINTAVSQIPKINMDNFNTIKEMQEESVLDNSQNNKKEDGNYKQVEVQISESGIVFDNYSFFKQDSQNKADKLLQQNAQKKEERIEYLKKELQERIITYTNIQICKGLKTGIEDLIILAIWTSALFKMNIQSLIDFSFVLLFFFNRSPSSIKIIMNSISIVFIVRMCIIISNMTSDLNPMPSPDIFNGTNQFNNNTFFIPWINKIHQVNQQAQSQNDNFIEWTYWLTLIMFKAKLPCLFTDFTSIFLFYIYNKYFLHWALQDKAKNLIVNLSVDSREKLIEYVFLTQQINIKNNNSQEIQKIAQKIDSEFNLQIENYQIQDSQAKINKTISSKFENQIVNELPNIKDKKQSIIRQNQSINDSNNSNSFEIYKLSQQFKQNREQNVETQIFQPQDQQNQDLQVIKQVVEDLKKSQPQHKFLKFSQAFLNFYYPKLMIAMILILSIMSNTLFSLGYVLMFCIIMMSNSLFLDTFKAKSKLLPRLKFWLVPYMLVELLLQFLFQMPFEYSESLKNAADIIGLKLYYSLTIEKGIVTISQKQDIKQLWCKALAYFFISIQIQIIGSKNFQQLNLIKKFGQMQGQAIVYYFNNKKLRTYFQFQEKNFLKEIMMIKIKEKCEQWKALFETDKKQKEQLKQNQSEQNRQNEKDLSNKDIESSKKPLDLSDIDLKYQTEEENQIDSSKTPKILKKARGVQINKEFLKSMKLENENLSINNIQSFSLKSPQKQIQDKKNKLLEQQKRNQLIESHAFQNVNYDFLALRDISQKRMEQNENFKKIVDERDIEDSICFLNYEETILLKNNSEFKEKYDKKYQSLNPLVRLYIYLRKVLINPVLLAQSEEKLKLMLVDFQNGEIYSKSEIEIAIINDINQEMKTGIETDENVQKIVSANKMLNKYLYLLRQTLISNLQNIAYIAMLYLTMKNVGALTLIYPLSLFGYAILKETSPSKNYWYFLLIYTQTYMLFEFSLSNKYFAEYKGKWKYEWDKYYTGLRLPKGDTMWDLLRHFHPEIIFLFTVMMNIQNQILLGFFDFQIEQKEKIEDAYIRYLKGQFQVQVKKQDFNEIYSFQELRREIIEYFNEFQISRDDFDLYLSSFDSNQQKNFTDTENIFALDQSQFDEKKCFSENDVCIYNDFEIQKIDATQKKTCTQKLEVLFLKNEFMDSLFPTVKIQKPGYDMYSIIALLQVLICLYIFLFYTQMTGQQDSILSQVSKNQFSGDMVIVLFCQVLIMVFERVIYKQRQFIEDQSSKEYSKIQQEKMKIIISQTEQLKNKGPNNQIQVSSQKIKENEEIELKITSEQLLAKNKTIFQNVIKFYYQWLMLICWNIFLMFGLPMYTNYQILGEYPYCVDSKYETTKKGGLIVDNSTLTNSSQQCNYMFLNTYIQVFYLLYCVYFYVSALQIKKGLPELYQSQFMMADYGSLNRNTFNVYMQIPFLFELRLFIDWTFTNTSLDLFQWIKLAQIQADLFKAKSSNSQYFQKKLGQKVSLFQKCSIGALLIIFIIFLIVGPLFLFSTYITKYLDTNPIQSANFQLSLLIQNQANEEDIPYQILQLNSFYKILTLNNSQYNDNMEFNKISVTANYQPDQTQYLIMNQATDLWLMNSNTKNEIKNILQNVKNGSQPLPQRIRFKVQYQFISKSQNQQSGPLQSKQYFEIYNPAYNISNTQVIESLLGAFNNTNTTMTIYGSNQSREFMPVLYLDTTNSNKITELQGQNFSYIYNKALNFSYTYFQNSSESYWQLYEQNISQQELNLQQSLNFTEQNQTSIKMFGISRKIAPFFLSQTVYVIYATYVLLIFKTMRSSLLGQTSAIPITDAKDPIDILMLCETIHLCRLKQMLKKEEELYFLLIDIMRSPVILKAICGDSIKTEQFQDNQKNKQKQLQDSYYREEINQQSEKNQQLTKRRRQTKFNKEKERYEIQDKNKADQNNSIKQGITNAFNFMQQKQDQLQQVIQKGKKAQDKKSLDQQLDANKKKKD